jgi:VIT1/CCC1 family predicted Fe2+/Mn2+ transporter
MKTVEREYLRSVMFGVEDSLISTTGLIAGISVGADNKKIVILGAVVSIVIEAVSMGVGEYLSDDAVQELDKIKRHENSKISGLLMFGANFLAGLIPLTPIILFDYPVSLYLAISAALFGLFLLGYFKGRLLNIHPIQGGVKILVVGGLATILGVIVGLIFKVS